MNRRIFTGRTVAAALIASIFLSGSGDARRNGASPGNRVVIDGRSFVPDESPGEDRSPLERELAGMGVRLPEGFERPEEPPPGHPALAGRLKGAPPPPREGPRLPPGLTGEHTLRMEKGGTPVDLVFGRLGTTGSSIRSRMLSSGWESASAGEEPGGTHVLTTASGKETVIVCLDETEGTFLLFREMGR